MIVKRIIDGDEINIELTDRELIDAFYEQEHLFDIEDVQDKLAEMDDDEFAEYGLTRSYVDKDDIDEIAHKKRYRINKYGMNWESATEDAIYAYLFNNRKEDNE